MSVRGMPQASHAFMIFSAIFMRARAVFGTPCSSTVSPTTAAPYFFTTGRIVRRERSSPFTELTIAFPQQTRSAASMASALPQSICSGASHTACTAFITLQSASFSSISGSPAFTSRMSAPASVCSSACACIYP